MGFVVINLKSTILLLIIPLVLWIFPWFLTLFMNLWLWIHGVKIIGTTARSVSSPSKRKMLQSSNCAEKTACQKLNHAMRWIVTVYFMATTPQVFYFCFMNFLHYIKPEYELLISTDFIRYFALVSELLFLLQTTANFFIWGTYHECKSFFPGFVRRVIHEKDYELRQRRTRLSVDERCRQFFKKIKK